MYLSVMCVCVFVACTSVWSHVFADKSLFEEAMPLQRPDLSLCVRERKEEDDGFITPLFQTSISTLCQRRKTQLGVCVALDNLGMDHYQWVVPIIHTVAIILSHYIIFYSCLDLFSSSVSLLVELQCVGSVSLCCWLFM